MRIAAPRRFCILALLFVAPLPGWPASATVSLQEHGEPAQETATGQEQPPGTQEPAADQEHGVAGEHGDEETAGHEEKPWWDFPARLINFGMLLGLLYWLLVVPPTFVIDNFDFPGLKVVLGERVAGIQVARRLAQEQTKAAAKYEAESAARLGRVQEEASALVTQARAAAATDRQRIEAAAVDHAAQIRDRATRDLNVEAARSRRRLQLHVADLAVGIARRIVRDNLTGEDQDRLVLEYLDRLGESVTTGS